ncbi:MAG: hypothetical protein J6L83_09930 [Clostridia bacterium]|nr:hypothetical protein [Clostridia bacterium]
MKKIRDNKILSKVLSATLSSVIALGSTLVAMPTLNARAADEGGNSAVTQNTGADVDIALGLDGLRDPVKNTTSSGISYVPSDYIYLGNNNRGAMLWRVLSSGTDNEGNEGSVFVMSEYLEPATLAGKSYDEAYLSYFNDAEKAVFLYNEGGDSSVESNFGENWNDPAPEGYFFAPSMSEINRFVADWSGASALRAYTDASRSTNGAWWTRSANVGGVGYVSNAGEVYSETNTGKATYYNRIAANLDPSNVTFSTRVDGGWRLALLDTDYAEDGLFNFAAWITGFDGTVVEISYVNAKPKDLSDAMGEYVSVIVTDKDGNVKHYEQLGQVETTEAVQKQAYMYEEGAGYTMLSPGEHYEYQGSVSFDTAGVYDNAAGDRIYVFWEKAYDSRSIEGTPSLAYQTTASSSLVEICWHKPDPALPATCWRGDHCVTCGTLYGENNVYDLDAHVDECGNSGIEWNQRLGMYRDDDGIFKDAWIHTGHCKLCDRYLPIDEEGYEGSPEPCYCEGVEVDCTNGAICDACGGYFVDPMMHSYDHNGICNRNTHFAEPRLVDGVYQISTVGNLLWYSDYTNKAEFAGGGEIAGAILLKDIDFAVLDAEKYEGKYTASNWTPICSVGHELDVDGDGETDGTYTSMYNATFDGNGYEIRNLRCVSGEFDSIGFIGYARGNGGRYPKIRDLGFVDCYFENTNSDQRGNAAVVGSSDYECKIEGCYVKNTTIIGKGYVGGIIGYAMNGDDIKNCYAIDLTLLEDGNVVNGWIARYASTGAPAYCFAYGENAGVLGSDGNGFHMGTHINKGYACYYLSENGIIDFDESSKTAEQFESGLVAYYLGAGFGQSLGEQSYPTLGGATVYQVSVCGGEGINKYTYSNENKITHVADETRVCGEQLTCKVCGEKFGDVVEHKYTDFDPATGFIWADSYTSCEAQTYCKYCGQKNPETIKTTVNFNFNGGIRADYVANVYIDGKQYTSDVKWVIITTIDEATGIYPSSERFTGWDYYAYDLVTNTKMKAGEYDAYFLLDGEMVGESARDVGVYDLYIVGKGRFDHQTYTYENFFTIEKIEVEMTVSVKDRVVDGTPSLKLDISFSDGNDYSHVIGIRADQYELPSAEVGKYEITGIGFYYYDDNDVNNITITHNTTATATILPRNYVEIINTGYKLEYEYGEKVPAPKQSDFEVDEGSTLTFTWFKNGTLLRDVPTAVGEYVLRVSASATDEYIASSVEYLVSIAPKQIELVIDPYGECETEIEELGYDDDGDGEDDVRIWYLVEMGETIPVYVVGMPGIDEPVPIDDERFKATGFDIYWRLYLSDQYTTQDYGYDYGEVFPKEPNSDEYRMRGEPHSGNSFGVSSDVGFGDDYGITYYFKVKSPTGAVAPIQDSSEYDGNVKDIYAAIAPPKWNVPVEDFKGEDDNPTIKYVAYISESADIENTFLPGGPEIGIEYLSDSNPALNMSVKCAGEYFVSVVASYIIYTWEGPIKGEKEVMRVKITVTVFDKYGDMVDEICDAGNYTVCITTEAVDESGNVIGEAFESAATYRVKEPMREVYLLVKETEINLDGEAPKYDEKDIVFLPGYTLSPGHRIADLVYDIELGGYVGAFNRGTITVKSWTIVDADGNDVSDSYVIYSKLYQWSEKYEEVYDTDFVNTKNHSVVHAYSNSCDSTCNIDGCTAMRDVEPHRGGEATCISLAICEVCGEEYGGYSHTNHVDTKTVYVQNTSDFRYHDLAMACCGEAISTELHTVTKAATCTSLAECKLCGVVEGSYDRDNHTSKEMYYATSEDDPTQHEYRHSCCDAVESVGEHKGGEATCTSLAVCDICKLGYGRLDAENHSSEEYKYTCVNEGDTTHAIYHACCDAYVGTEHHSGGEATCAGKAACEKCGAEYGDINTSNHASEEFTYSAATIGNFHYAYYTCCGVKAKNEEHSGGEATCKTLASCALCGVEYGEYDPQKHESEEYTYAKNKSDASKHDKIATCCGAVIATEAHSGGNATCKERAVCEICSASYGELSSHTYANACDSDCDECGAERISGHVDADKNRVCDLCSAELTVADTETDTETESSDEETETESKIENESGTGEDVSEGGCGSAIGAGGITLIVTATLAGIALIKRKKEN